MRFCTLFRDHVEKRLAGLDRIDPDLLSDQHHHAVIRPVQDVYRPNLRGRDGTQSEVIRAILCTGSAVCRNSR